MRKTEAHGDDKSRGSQELYSGFIRIHILYHACRGPIFGLGIMEELARHGYKLSAGTLYPMLHGLEKKGYLHSTQQRSGRWVRRIYRATTTGRRALAQAREIMKALVGELLEDASPRQHSLRHQRSST
jgi:PadR family transcriptional regulator, regulatory protein PadR